MLKIEGQSMTDSCWPAVVVFLLWILVPLKLLGILSWSWVAVTSPVWLTLMVLAAFYLTAFTLIVIEEFIL